MTNVCNVFILPLLILGIWTLTGFSTCAYHTHCWQPKSFGGRAANPKSLSLSLMGLVDPLYVASLEVSSCTSSTLIYSVMWRLWNIRAILTFCSVFFVTIFFSTNLYFSVDYVFVSERKGENHCPFPFFLTHISLKSLCLYIVCMYSVTVVFLTGELECP